LYLLSVSLCLPASLGHAKKSNVSNNTVAAAAFAFLLLLLFGCFCFLVAFAVAADGVVFCLFIWSRATQQQPLRLINRVLSPFIVAAMFQILFIYLLPLNWLNNVAIGQRQQPQQPQQQVKPIFSNF